ncbi:MAG: hypothetical protein AAFO75_05230, partial [Pseudomonadota bacterium]
VLIYRIVIGNAKRNRPAPDGGRGNEHPLAAAVAADRNAEVPLALTPRGLPDGDTAKRTTTRPDRPARTRRRTQAAILARTADRNDEMAPLLAVARPFPPPRALFPELSD